MSGVKEIAQRVATTAIEKHIRFPKIWDESKIVQACGTTLMLHRNSSGFDEKETLDDLIKTYGYEAGFEPEEPVVKGSPTKKRKGVKDEGEKDQAGSPSSVKKVRKTDIVAREENRAAAEAIKEMADIYFKNKDNRKGGVFSKAAKAIREAEVVITDKKSAMKLPGVGKGIAGYMEELQEKGSIKHLEELRAGTA